MDKNTDLVKILQTEHQKLIKGVQQQTEYLFNLIPNVTTALIAMLQLPPDKIHWANFDIDDNIIVLGVIIKFSPANIPMFVQIFAPHTVVGLDKDDDEEITQLMRVGLPLELISSPPTEIIQFFHDLANSTDDEIEEIEQTTEPPSTNTALSSPISPNDTPFDVSGLSESQIANFLLYQNNSSSAKH